MHDDIRKVKCKKCLERYGKGEKLIVDTTFSEQKTEYRKLFNL